MSLKKCSQKLRKQRLAHTNTQDNLTPTQIQSHATQRDMQHLTSILNLFYIDSVLLNFHSEIQPTSPSKASAGRPMVVSETQQCNTIKALHHFKKSAVRMTVTLVTDETAALPEISNLLTVILSTVTHITV